jgi:hypothetical protein
VGEGRVLLHEGDGAGAAPAERVHAGVDDEPAGAPGREAQHAQPVERPRIEPELVRHPLGATWGARNEATWRRPQSNLIDVSVRAAGSTQITAEQAAMMRDPSMVPLGWQPPR